MNLVSSFDAQNASHTAPVTQVQKHANAGGGSPTPKALEAAGLYTLKWLILCYVNFASIKSFKHPRSAEPRDRMGQKRRQVLRRAAALLRKDP